MSILNKTREWFEKLINRCGPEPNEFTPDWASPPGDTMRDILVEKNIPTKKFASLMFFTPKQADNLISGRTIIDANIAHNLSVILGASPKFWLARERQYRKTLKRLGGA